MKPSYLVKGFPGHPTHPPLTDATIGMYALAAILAVLSALGVAEENTAKAWWLALIIGLIVNAPTSMTGVADWFEISSGTPLKRTATTHMLVMITATAFLGLAAIFGHDDYVAGDLSGASLLLTLVGFAFLTAGGWIGGTIVYVHGMRVLNLVAEPSARAVTPGRPEKAAAAGEEVDEPALPPGRVEQ